MESLVEQYCHSRVRCTVYQCFPPLYVVAALAIFSLPGLLFSPAVTVGWVIHGLVSGSWWTGAEGFLALGPFLLAVNLVGLLHTPMLEGWEGPPIESYGRW